MMKRYRDAFVTATIVVGFSKVVKVTGIVVGVLILLASAGVGGVTGFFVGLIFGALVAVSFYFFGVIIAAQGQVLRATLDTAVNSSPFLDYAQKAEVILRISGSNLRACPRL